MGLLESNAELSEFSDSGSEYIISGISEIDSESAEQDHDATSEIHIKPKGRKRVKNQKMW